MKKTIYFPEHMSDKLRRYRERYKIEEPIALLRLISDALRADEVKTLNEESITGTVEANT